jgi:hypothetical protein
MHLPSFGTRRTRHREQTGITARGRCLLADHALGGCGLPPWEHGGLTTVHAVEGAPRKLGFGHHEVNSCGKQIVSSSDLANQHGSWIGLCY